MARRVGSKPGQALRSRRHPPHWLRGCVVSGHALPPPPGIEVVAASPVFRCRRARPPARRPRCEPMVRRVGSKPGQVHLSCSPRVPQPLGPLSISHVIPSRLFQTLNSQRWNCNVLGRSRKMTAGNYVRHYSVRSCSSSPRCGSGSPRAGVWYAVCGVRCVVCGVWCVVCGVRRVVLGAWCVVRGVWCWSGPSQLWSSCPSTAGPSINFARNSLATISNFEFAALELQRFGA